MINHVGGKEIYEEAKLVVPFNFQVMSRKGVSRNEKSGGGLGNHVC